MVCLEIFPLNDCGLRFEFRACSGQLFWASAYSALELVLSENRCAVVEHAAIHIILEFRRNRDQLSLRDDSLQGLLASCLADYLLYSS
jgi:hypothetical protein